MEEEWIKWLRENRPDLYEQMKKSVWWQAEWRDNNIAALEQRVKELEAERVSDGLAGQAALDEANNRVCELENQKEYEQRRNAISYKCFICGGALDSYSKCTACYDALGAECDRLRAENERLRDWKESSIEVENRWDVQAVAKLMELLPGSDIRSNIEPYMRRLKTENERLKEDIFRLKGDHTAYFTSIEAFKKENAKLRHDAVGILKEQFRENLLSENERLRAGIKSVEGLINDSQGVYGLHLNGDCAPWETLRTGGQFEEWLLDFDKALGGGE